MTNGRWLSYVPTAIDRFLNLPVPDYEADDILVVAETEQLRALADDVRLRIVSILRDRAASTTELAEQVGLAKGTIAHHLKVLEGAGLVRVVRTRRVRALTESFYGRVARLYVLKSADDKPQAKVRLSAADAASFQRRVEELLRDFEAAASAPRRGVRARRGPVPERRHGMRLWPGGGLWRHHDFLKLWSAQTISVFGSQIGGFALPLVAIITLDASPFAVSTLLVVEFAPFLLISLPAGVWVDRLPRRSRSWSSETSAASSLSRRSRSPTGSTRSRSATCTSSASSSVFAPSSSTSPTSRTCPRSSSGRSSWTATRSSR